MPNKMERFTQRARRVLGLAQEEAERFQHNYIGTEHLLLGLIREEGGVAGRVLNNLGIQHDRVSELIQQLNTSPAKQVHPQIDLSPGTKKVLELAVDEARRMGHHYIGTEHLLLGLTRQSDGTAIEVLKRLGISPEEIRRQTRRVLQEAPIAPPVSSTDSPSSDAPPTEPSRGRSSPQSGELDVSPAVAKLLQSAAYEARLAHKSQVEMEHILMALVRQYEGTIGGILRILRLSPEEVRRIINTNSASGDEPPQSPSEADPEPPSPDDESSRT